MIPELAFPRGSFKIPKKPNLSLKLPRGSFKLEIPKKRYKSEFKTSPGKSQLFSDILTIWTILKFHMNLSLKILKSEI